MFRDRMNKIIGSKAFNIVFAILVSIALWLYIAYAENSDVTQPYNNIDITFTGDDVVSERNLSVTNIDTDTLSLKIRGKRNVISKLSKNAITVTADMSVITNSGVFQVPYTVDYDGLGYNSNNLYIVEASVDYITVTVSKMVDVVLPVTGQYEGRVADGYRAEPMEFNPQSVTVSGPEELVSTLHHAMVILQRDTVSKAVTDTLSYKLIDNDGQEISADNFKLSTDKIKVTLPIVMVKDVALSVKLVPGAGASEENTKITIRPSSITLSGDAETLENMNTINLDTIDLTDFASTFTETYSIAIPNGVTNLTGTTEATVTVQVLGMSTNRLSVTNIRTQNVTEGYVASIVTQSLDVTVRGSSADISQLKADNIWIVADLSDLGNAAGTFSVDARVHIDGFPNMGAVGEYKITVSLTEASAQNESSAQSG